MALALGADEASAGNIIDEIEARIGLDFDERVVVFEAREARRRCDIVDQQEGVGGQVAVRP